MSKSIGFNQTCWGLNSVSSTALLSSNELSEATNVKLDDFGALVSRDGLEKVTISGTENSAAIKHIAYIPIGSNNYIFVVDENYKLYKCTGTEPNLILGSSIATLEGDTTLTAFNGYCVIADGSYLKRTQGTSVSLCYDDGEGSGGYNYSNLCMSCDATTSLYLGSTTRCGSKFTTDTWDAGYTIPLTRLDVWISKVGTIAGTLYAKLYSSNGTILLDTSTTTYTDNTLTLNATKLKFTFTGSYGMASNTSYIIAVEYAAGDASNYIKIHSHTETSGGDNYYFDGTWHSVSTKSTVLGVKPGIPPKAKFGDVWKTRLFLAGDPDHPGYMWYSNINTSLDWSTTAIINSTNTGFTAQGAGYISAVDDNANSYSVGSIIPFFGDLYVFGTEKQPYLSKLTGTTPDDFSLPSLFQQIDTSHTVCIGLMNDVWFCSKDSVHNLKGVQEFGDIRTFSPGDSIKNKIVSYYDSNAFASYNPADGQYMLKLSGYDNILVCHTANPFLKRETAQHASYVWVEYALCSGIIASAFNSFNGYFYIGAENGYMYKLDDSLVEDDGNTFDIEIKSGIQTLPFQDMSLKNEYFEIISEDVSTCDIDYYKNGTSNSSWNKEIDIKNVPWNQQINFTCSNLQISLSNFSFTAPINFGKMLFMEDVIKMRRV